MNNHPKTCFACGEGHCSEVVEDYSLTLPEGDILIVPQLHLLRCDQCGEDTLPPASSRRIEMAIDQHQDTFSPPAIRAFLEQFDIDQTEAAEALGMGSKTFHRWAHGTQRVSRSMGYFLRSIMAHPAIFEWIQNRRWRDPESGQIQMALKQTGGYWEAETRIRFPAISEHINETSTCENKQMAVVSFNAARVLLSANIT